MRPEVPGGWGAWPAEEAAEGPPGGRWKWIWGARSCRGGNLWDPGIRISSCARPERAAPEQGVMETPANPFPTLSVAAARLSVRDR